ncbi:MAG TPA: prepilin-type N-terminal cleavage/methylation domain-containing protein [Patescibacteria group bacterium]|nr:prepilin-type N-terminal cleavage/methylation domain-containing protein [Patescibacteria group bacterium]
MEKLRGFTLIEIVLVIALIGVTASVVISLVNPVQQFKKANDAKRKADLTQLQAALELYRADQDTYPDSLPACGSSLVGGTATYLQRIPCDPRNTGQFMYNYERLTFNTYQLIACLENTTDINKDATNNTTYCEGDTTNWSYTVTNP